jgi:hypothetical protein
MKLEELQEILKHHLNPPPKHREYTEITIETIDGYDRNTIVKPIDKIEEFLPLLEGFVFDAHRANGNVVFIKPEIHVV